MSFDLAAFFVYLADVAAPVAPVAPAAGDAVAQAPNQWMMPVMLLLTFAGLYFLMIAPQRKRQKEIEKKQSEMKTGDRVITTAGIIGKIAGIDGDVVTLQVSEGTRIPFQRQAIVSFVSDEKPAEKKN